MKSTQWWYWGVNLGQLPNKPRKSYRGKFESVAIWKCCLNVSKQYEQKIEILRGCCSGLLLPGSKRSPNEFHLAMTNHMSFVRLFFTWDLSLRKANIVPPNERPLNEIVYGDLRIDVCETHGLIVLPPRWNVFMCLNNYFFGHFFEAKSIEFLPTTCFRCGVVLCFNED